MPTKSEVLAAWHACRAANEAFFATFFAAYPRGSIIQWVDRVDGCRVKGRLLGPTIAYTCPGVVHSGPVKVEEECVAIEHWESGTLMSVETVVEHNEPQNMTTTIYTDAPTEYDGFGTVTTAEADAAAEIVIVAKLAGADPAVLRILRAVLVERDKLRGENARVAAKLAEANQGVVDAVCSAHDERGKRRNLAADLAAARSERDGGVGLVAMIESMTTHAEDLRGKLDAASAERDAARQEAADWRTLLACGWEEAEHLARFIAWHYDEDCRREIPRHFAALIARTGMPAEVTDAARRLAAPHLNPTAEGGGK